MKAAAFFSCASIDCLIHTPVAYIYSQHFHSKKLGGFVSKNVCLTVKETCSNMSVSFFFHLFI